MRHWLLYVATMCCLVASAFLPQGCQTAKEVEVKVESPIMREGSKVWIDGVPTMPVGNVNDDWTALLKGVHLLLTHRGEKTTLDEVMVCSGDAFNLCHGARWELRTLHTVPTDTVSNVAKAYGYEGRWIPPRFFWELKRLKKEERKAESDKFLAQIWSEIDAGRPVLMGGTHGQCASWRVVVGHDRQNEKICYMGGEGAYEWTDLMDPKVKEIGFWDMQIRGTTRKGHYGGWIANTAFLLGEKKRNVPEEDRASVALRLAADLHTAEPFRTNAYGAVTYYFGAQAYEQWAKDLHELDYPADRKKPRPKTPECYDMSQQWFQADQIVRGRNAAAAFCEKAAEALPEVKTHLLAAANAYRDEVAIAKEAFAALRSGNDEQREAWQADETKREAGVVAIRQMLEKERVAIAQIEKALPSAKGLDYSKLELEADHHAKDSFSLVVQEAARLLGKEAEYETIYALSTNGFAPDIRPDEPCKSFWRLRGRGTCLDIVAGRIGLTVSPINLPDPPPLPKPGPDGRTWGTEPYNQWIQERLRAVATRIRPELDAGKVVITDGAIDPLPYHWGILVEAREDGTILGALQNGRRDNRMGSTFSRFWALSSADATVSPAEADLAMLRRALSRIRGDKEPFLPGNVVFGLAAMDLWIAQMNKPAFQEDDPGSSAGNARLCALYSCQGPRDAASYLRKRIPTFPKAAQPHVESIARHYERIAELLEPFTALEADGYMAIMGDLEKQKAHATGVLEPAKAEMAAAADDIVKALTSTQNVMEKPTMKEEGAKVWIEGVPRGARGNRYGRSVSILLESVGVSADYDEVMGRSGLAFITQARDGQPIIDGAIDVGWWPLDPWGFYMRHDFIGKAFGWSVTKIECDIDAYRADAAMQYRERFEPAVKEAIAAGKPAIAIHDGCFVVRGYDDKDLPLLGNWSCSDAAEDIRIPGYPWGLIVLGKEEEPMAPADVDREALRYAVALFRDDGTRVTTACPFERPPTRFTGRRAFELWTKALRNTKNLGQARWHANMVFNLRINRRCAVAYLHAMAKRYPENVAKHLNAAAGLYQKELALLHTADTSKAALIVKPAGRRDLATLVEKLAETEGAAIASIEKALAAGLARGLTEDQLKRLAQWGSMWGKLDGCLRAAGREPIHFELLREELALEPISDDARQIRGKMLLEPADSCYPAQIEALLRSIATGKLTGPWPPAGTPEREARLKKLAVALRAWSGGDPKADASKREGTDAATVEEVYGYLGVLDDEKKAAVAITIEKLETGYSERAVKIERKGLDNPETLEEALAHNVSMCDTQCWTFEHNLKVLLTRIGNKTMNGGWGEPDGPIGWSGPRAMNPELKPRLTAIVGGLKAWTAGKPGEGESKQVAEQLGKRDAYKEKVWLARCLHNYLSHHLAAAGY